MSQCFDFVIAFSWNKNSFRHPEEPSITQRKLVLLRDMHDIAHYIADDNFETLQRLT